MSELFTQYKIIPVITLEKPQHAVPLAEALQRGGIHIMEITLRTDIGLGAIAAIRQALPTMLVGAGTVTTPERLKQAVYVGAQFLVSPGLTSALADSFLETKLPCLPGVATLSEAMQASVRGFRHLKFFPAAASGGVEWLKSVAAVLPDISFCPTGGVEAANAAQYLAVPNVFAVGGSWLVPKKLLQEENWPEIEALARAATRL